MIIALEGLPGAGKTSTAELLAQRLEVQAVCETTQNHPFLDSVYRDDERHDLEVELAFLLLHSSAWRAIDRSVVTMTDFSPAKDVLFAEAMLSDPPDKALFDHAYQRLYEGYRPADVVVYLRARPDLCIERVRKRYEEDEHREFEKDMGVERLARMEHFYEHGLPTLGDDVLVLDLDEVLEPTDSESASKDRVVSAVVELLGSRIHL
ncbi:MAG: deoxynucleoside kinase [Solirubrobacterales bacterium]